MSSRRIYRRECDGSRFTSFAVTIKESDLWIAVSSPAFSETLHQRCEQMTWQLRHQLERYLADRPQIQASLEPYLLEADAPLILRKMARAGNQVGVGPMAAVAGAIAEAVGLLLLDYADEVIVENGGDIFISVIEPVNIGIYAGNSPLSGKLALRIEPARTPLGVCTSSATVGPSLSLGSADAAVAISASTPLADAAATALGNMVNSPDDFQVALDYARNLDQISGALLICGDKIAAWGEVELVKT
jgi:uncharacterized protein